MSAAGGEALEEVLEVARHVDAEGLEGHAGEDVWWEGEGREDGEGGDDAGPPEGVGPVGMVDLGMGGGVPLGRRCKYR